MRTPGDMVAALAAVLTAIGDGMLTTEEGAAIGALLTAQRTALEAAQYPVEPGGSTTIQIIGGLPPWVSTDEPR